MDYNSIVDFLEEEHQKRDVFTTVVKKQEAEPEIESEIPDNLTLQPQASSTVLEKSERGPRRRRSPKEKEDRLD